MKVLKVPFSRRAFCFAGTTLARQMELLPESFGFISRIHLVKSRARKHSEEGRPEWREREKKTFHLSHFKLANPICDISVASTLTTGRPPNRFKPMVAVARKKERDKAVWCCQR